MSDIKLGYIVRDSVTGFEGVAISRVEYLNGCVQFCVKPQVDKDGKMRDGEYIDIQQLVVDVVKTEQSESFNNAKTGGAMTDAPSEGYSND